MSWKSEYDLPDVAIALHQAMSVNDGFDRKGRKDSRLKPALRNQRPDFRFHGLRKGRLEGIVPAAQGAPCQMETAGHQLHEAQFRTGSAHHSDHHEAALRTQQLQIPAQIVAADHIENNINPLPLKCLFEGGLPIVDRATGTHPFTGGTFFGSPRRRKNKGSACIRQLDRGEPDPATASVHEETLTPAETTTLEYIAPNGEDSFGDRRRFRLGDGLRYREAVSSLHRDELSISTSGQKRAHGITRLPPLHFVSTRFDDARYFEPGHVTRYPRWCRIAPFPLHQISPVESCRGYPNPHL